MRDAPDVPLTFFPSVDWAEAVMVVAGGFFAGTRDAAPSVRRFEDVDVDADGLFDD